MNTADKFLIQDSQYSYPYHHIPFLDSAGVPRRVRGLDWGLEYLCYQLHALDVVASLRPTSVLEIGCGDGRFIGMLSGIAPRRVGVDLSEASIRFARAFHPDVDFHCAGVEVAGIGYDVVAAIEVLEHIPDADVSPFLEKALKAVKVGGRLLLSVPSTNVPLHKKHYRHYDDELLLTQVRNADLDVEIERLEYVCYISPTMRRILHCLYNKYVIIESSYINKILWKRIWERGRVVDRSRGRHVLAVLRRKA